MGGAKLSAGRGRLLQVVGCPRVDHRRDTIEDLEDEMVVTGLVVQDAILLVIGTVLPEIITVGAAWYVGLGLLVFSRGSLDMATRACMLALILELDRLVYASFISTSKRRWVESAQVLTLRGSCHRMSISWPGEVFKLAF